MRMAPTGTGIIAGGPMRAVFEMLGANVQKAFRWKPEIDLRQLRALQELDAPAYAEAAKYFTSKPAKPSVTLKD